MKRIIKYAVLAFLMLILFITTFDTGSALGASKTTVPLKAGRLNLVLASGSSGGTFYVYSGGVAKIINSAYDNIQIQVESSSGSTANLALLETKQVDIGIIGAAPAYMKSNGINLQPGEKAYTGYRVLTPMYQEHFYALSVNSLFKTFRDLEGKIVATGPLTGGAHGFATNVFNALGMSVKIRNGNVSECASEVSDGRVDALVMPTGHPSPSIMEMESNKKINWIPIVKEDINKILEKCPFYSRAVLPKSTYKYLTEDYQTIGTWTFVTTTVNLDETAAYYITKALMENLDVLAATHSTGKQSLPENIIYSKVPIHKGALKYYREIGINIPDELIPPEAR